MPASALTFREMNLRVFERRPVPHVLFQPRFEPWVHWHQTVGTMPAVYAGMSVRDFYDQVGASMRYMQYYTGIPEPIRSSWSDEVRREEEQTATRRTVRWITPHGPLTQIEEFTVDQTWRTVVFPVQTPRDFRRLAWLARRQEFRLDLDRFAQGDAFLGPRGQPQFWVPKSPYQALAQTWSTLPALVYALTDCPGVVEEAMRAIDDSHDSLYRQLVAAADRVRIVNFGENLHEHLLSPQYVDRYFLPYYRKRVDQLRGAGIFTHVHIDGYWRGMLSRLVDLPFDGIEALTPKPQGDMDLESIRAHIGDKILLDGIPAILFLPSYSRDQLMRTVERIIDLFAPNLILGVSDEVPEGAGQEAMERIQLIADYCRTRTG